MDIKIVRNHLRYIKTNISPFVKLCCTVAVKQYNEQSNGNLCTVWGTEHKDYHWPKGNRTQCLSKIKRKQNTNTINDKKEIEHKDYQRSKGNRT